MTYLENQYPPARPLLPSRPHDRAITCGIAAEAHTHFYPPLRRLIEQTLFYPDGHGDQVVIQASLTQLQHELAYFEAVLIDDFLVGKLSIKDFTVYPLLALVS